MSIHRDYAYQVVIKTAPRDRYRPVGPALPTIEEGRAARDIVRQLVLTAELVRIDVQS